LAQSLKVSSFTQSGQKIVFNIQDAGNSTRYRLESSPSMAAGSWSSVTAVFTPVPGQAGFHQTTITRTVPGKLLYRVVGLISAVTAEDSDGDGLENEYEKTLGTFANLAGLWGPSQTKFNLSSANDDVFCTNYDWQGTEAI
jgi:hypothetical protein